jgi:hypothetical protein
MTIRTTHQMHPESVIIARVSAVVSAVITVVAAVVIATAVGAFSCHSQ